MANIKSISIPKPCHQSWQQMEPADQGRYCQSCCKTVTDFSVMTDGDIIRYLSSRSNVCGRFEDHQLTRINQQLQPEKPSYSLFKKAGLAAAVLIAIPFAKANAQKKHKTEQGPAKHARRDTLKIHPIPLTATDIKITPAVVEVKNGEINTEVRDVSYVVGGLVATGINLRPQFKQIYLSVYDMLRDY
jgi:hypothetical protein